MHNSPPIDRRLLGDDARHRLPSRPHIIVCEDGMKQKEVTVIERNHCCQGFRSLNSIWEPLLSFLKKCC